MKKLLSLILSIVLVFSLVGCNEAAKEEVINPEDENTEDILEKDTIGDYYPFEKDRLMDYQGKGNEFAEMKSFVEFIDGDLIQIKKMNPGTNIVNVLELKDGVLREVFAEGEFYHLENMLNTNRNTDNIILKEPLEVGNSWADSDGNKVEITSLDKKIETPLKEYKALEVTTSYEGSSIKREYYARGVGFVASVYEDGEFKVETLLKGIEKKGMQKNIRAYYPRQDDIEIRYLDRSMVFNTNNNIKSILENLLKEPDSDKLLAPISKDTSIKSIDLNRDDWTLDIDFSKEFKEDMNAGSSYEIAVINSVVNTLGDFYDVERVHISIEGEPYESGHLKLLEGEYFEVDIEGIKELK